MCDAMDPIMCDAPGAEPGAATLGGTPSPAPAGGAPAGYAKLWTCPDCGFGFDAEHTTSSTGGYDCPLCAEARLDREVAALRIETERLRHRAEYAEQAIEALAVCSHAVLYSEASGQVTAVLGVAGQAAHQTYRGSDVTDVLHVARRNGVRADVLRRATPTPAAPGAHSPLTETR